MIVSGQNADGLARPQARRTQGGGGGAVDGTGVERVIRERTALTGDLGGEAGTRAMGDAIARRSDRFYQPPRSDCPYVTCTSILRGLACSALGMRSFSTPCRNSAPTFSEFSSVPSVNARR